MLKHVRLVAIFLTCRNAARHAPRIKRRRVRSRVCRPPPARAQCSPRARVSSGDILDLSKCGTTCAANQAQAGASPARAQCSPRAHVSLPFCSKHWASGSVQLLAARKLLEWQNKIATAFLVLLFWEIYFCQRVYKRVQQRHTNEMPLGSIDNNICPPATVECPGAPQKVMTPLQNQGLGIARRKLALEK